MEAETASSMSEFYSINTLLIMQDGYIEFSHCKNFNSSTLP